MAFHEQVAQPSGMGMHGAMPAMLDKIGTSFQSLVDAGAAMLADAAAAPGRLGQAANLLTDNGASGSLDAVLAWAALVVVAALLAAALLSRLLRPARARLAARVPDSAGQTASLIVRALLVDFAPPVAYLAVGLLLDHALFGKHALAFAASEAFHMVFSAGIVNSALAWLGCALIEVPIAAERPRLRLLPLDDADARQARRFIRWVVALGAASWILAESLFLLWLGDGVPRIILLLAALVIGALCLSTLAQVQSRFVRFGRVWHYLAVISVFGLMLTWAHGLLLYSEPPFGRVLGTLAILAAIPFLDGMGALVLGRIRARLARIRAPARTIYVPTGEGEVEALRAVERPLEGPALVDATSEVERALDGFMTVLHDAFYLVLSIAAAVLLAKTWSLNLVGLLVQGQARTVLGALVDAGATLLVGWYAWRFFETGLALRLSREEGGLQSRARTVQPLLRSVGKVVIGAVALMGALSELGLNIAPLLASAGVVGIAVGFGAQTLVKDLFSGACYLIEDVFRIGDYIEAGTAKGTVEKITFRTVALRHQNGPLHFVPYGSLGSVRNNSRDWVIDKFEIPLPIGVPSEQIRKMVKRIGQEMMEDEKLAKVITEPLKAKLYRIQPGAKIFRCKVQTPPGQQFEVRSEAYRRIEQALAEAGIPYADTTPQVTVQNTIPPLAEAPPAAPVRAAE